MKKSLMGALAGIILTGCITITPRGSIDLAYVPTRTDDQRMENEVMIELDAGLEAKVVEGILKNLKIKIGGRQRTYMYPFIDGTIYFSPNRQEYDFYGKINYKNLEIYAERMCSHPIDKEEFWLYDEETDTNYRIHHDAITKFGLKLEF